MPIYFIQEAVDGGAIKIGYTGGDPFARLASLQTGNSKPLKMLAFAPGGPPEERGLHERFADLRLHGEWFRPDPRLLGFIDGMRWAFPAEQRRKPTEAPTLYGFTGEQIQFILGVTEGVDIGDKVADAEVIAFDETDVLSDTEFDALSHAKYLASQVLNPAVPTSPARLDGRSVGSGDTIPSALDRINEALSRHHMAAAEQRLADDRNDGANPSILGALEEVDAHTDMSSDDYDDLLPHEAH